MDDYNYSGDTSDYDSNISNEAPSPDWYDSTYGGESYGGDTVNDNGSFNGQFFFDDAAQGTPAIGNMFNTGGGYSGDLSNYDSQFTPDQMRQGTSTDWLSKIGSGLGSIFNTAKAGQPDNSWSNGLKGLGTLLAAQQMKSSQQKTAQQNQQSIQQQQQYRDPFASQRAQYQQALSEQLARNQAFQKDPYSDARFKTGVDAAINRLARLDRAKGRTAFQSQPEFVEAFNRLQDSITQGNDKTLSNLYNPAGANINPNMSGLLEAILQNNNLSNQGNSPYYNAIGSIFGPPASTGGVGSSGANQDSFLQQLASLQR